VSYEDELTYILDIDVYVRACVRARASVFCQNSGFKTRNYVDLYCEHYGDCANSE
jgi:putative hemolysin